jgi:hypothetical protein
MTMQHYFGAQAIVKRLGLKCASRLPELKLRLGVPCFLRSDPRCPWRRLYYSSESMIAAWELAKAKADNERLRTEQEAKTEAKKSALTAPRVTKPRER